MSDTAIPEDIMEAARSAFRGGVGYPSDTPIADSALIIYIARAILAERERCGWQTIETVPKDGTIVDLWHKEGFRVCDEWWDEEDGWTGGWREECFTHWIKATVTQP